MNPKIWLAVCTRDRQLIGVQCNPGEELENLQRCLSANADEILFEARKQGGFTNLRVEVREIETTR